MTNLSEYTDIPARMVGQRIEIPTAILRREAMTKHQAWLDEPTLANQLAYAQALKYWAKGVKNKVALAHAVELAKGESQ